MSNEVVSSVSNQCINEEVRSRYTYSKEYKGPKPINDQINAVAEIFSLNPNQALGYAKNLPALPEGAEGWFAIPSVCALAPKRSRKVINSADKYCRAVQLVHTKIKQSRPFCNYCYKRQIIPAHLRVSARTTYALECIAEKQGYIDHDTGVYVPNDIVIIAAQLGLRYRGRSVCDARESFAQNEFGLTSLAVGSIIVTHPERDHWEELYIDCAGDEIAPVANGDFSSMPFFCCYSISVVFGVGQCNNVADPFGSASGFLPEYVEQ
jgi:hypothetical protein